MPVITSIKPQKNNKRVNIYIDGKFGFGLDLENYMKMNLKVEQDLSVSELNKIVKKAEYQKTLDKILLFASLRPRSKWEFSNWMKRKKVHESLHKKLFDRLKYFDFVDDARFAEWWVGQRIRFKAKSKREIIFELRKKGIKRELIDKVVADSELDEKKNALISLDKKLYKWKKMEKMEAKQKMSEYLARKGFSWDSINEAVKSIFVKLGL